MNFNIENERVIKPNRIYRHYTGGLYYVEAIAWDYEVSERKIIFRECFAPYNIYSYDYSKFAKKLSDEMVNDNLNTYKQDYMFEEVLY